MAENYTAGRLLVAVIPDMRGGAAKIRKEFSGLGPYDVNVRATVDDKALRGLRTALRSLPDVVLTADSSPADRELAALRGRISSISDQTIGVDISAADARREVDSIRSDLERLGRESPEIGVRVDAAAAEAALREVSTELGRVDGRRAKVTVAADTGKANSELIATNALASRMDGRRVTMRILADTGRALAQILGIYAVAQQLVNRPWRMVVSADTAGAAAGILKIIALVQTLGGLIGIAGGLAGAIGGIGAAAVVAGAGIGAVIPAFLGVGKAIGALNDQQAEAGKSAAASAKAQESAARQVASAQRAVGKASEGVNRARIDGARAVDDAERSAARNIASAMRAQEDAQRQLVSANREARMAQQELTRAWEDGRRALEDLQDRVDDNALDQRQAAFDLADARKALSEAQAGGNEDSIARAQLALDRVIERQDQLGKRTRRDATDNAKAQAAGVAGTEQYVSALDRVRQTQESVASAQRSAAQASIAVDQAREDGARDVARAQEQAARSISDAQTQLIDSQRALTEALNDTRDAGTDAGDKVAEAFAGLSPAAAAFARYLFGLKPVLEELSAIAAAGLFPPLISGIDTLLGRLPLIKTVTGQLAAGMGAGLNLVLVTLANPLWAGYFTMLGNAAGTIIPRLFQSVMVLLGAFMELVKALLPIAPASLDILDALSGVIAALAGPLVQALSGMFPSVYAFLDALGFLGPLLVALSPILNAMGIALSQVLGAAMQALIPILTALTPYLVAFAESIAGSLVSAIQAATPFLVGLATWMSENPGLVMGVIGAVLGLMGVLRPLSFVLSVVALWAARAVAISVLGSIFAAVGLQGSVLSKIVIGLLRPFSALGLAVSAAGGPLALIRTVIMWIGRAILTALGPIGILIAAFGILYSSSEPFRNAVNGLLDVLMGLVGQIVSAVMPIFTVLGNVLSLLGSIVGMLVQQLAGALVPVINLMAGVLSQLGAAILPPLMQVVGALVPVIALLGQAFGEIVLAVVGPLIGALSELIGAVLPPLTYLLTNVVIPVITFLADLFATVLSWTITNVLIPAIKFLIPILVGLAGFLSDVVAWVVTNVVVPALNLLVPIFRWVGEAAMWLWENAIRPAWDAISAAAVWLWENGIKPAFEGIVTIFKFLAAIVFTVLVAPLLVAWNLISAAAVWLWENALQPTFQAIGDFIGWVWTNLIKPAMLALEFIWRNVIAPAATWLWENVIKPVFQALGAFIGWVWTNLIKPHMDALHYMWVNIIAPAAMWLWENVIKPAFEGIGAIISWVWEKVIQPAFEAVKQGLQWLGEKFDQVTNWIGDIWAKIKGFLAKPINFMINTVWNEGVVPAWNKVAELVGIGKIDPLPPIPEARTGGRVDSRGMIRGPGTGTSDSILGRVKENDAPIRVSNREFIVNERATAANLPLLTALNGGARIGDSGNERRARAVPAFAGGGPVWQGLWDTVRGRFPNARLTDSTRPGANDYHGRGMAIDVAGSYPMAVGQMLEINKWIGTTFPGSTELIHYPIAGGGAINLKNGGPHTYGLSTQLSHANHVHWAQDPANPQGGGNGGGAFAPISTFFMDSAREAFDTITNPAIDALRGLIGPPPPVWRDVVPSLATKIRDAARDFVFGKASEKDAQASAGGGGAMMGPVGDGEIFVIQQIADSARARGLGFDGAVIGVATGIVESGLRNLNYGDRDSLGVFQQRPSQGWGSPAQIMNVRYAADKFFNGLMGFDWRSMDPGAAAQRVQRSAFPARYGQAMGRARQLTAQHGGVFDSGGIARGKGIMFKDVIADERVLDPEETDNHGVLGDYRRMIEDGRLVPSRQLTPSELAAMGTGAGPGGREMHLHVHGDVNDPMDVDSLYNQLDFRERAETL